MVQDRYMTIIEALEGNSLFRELSPKERESLPERFNLRIRNYTAGKILRFQGDECRDLILLISGSITAGMQKPDGRTIIVERMTAPEAAASAIVFSDHGTLPVTLTAETDVSLVAIDKIVLLRMFQLYRSILEQYLTDMGNKVSFLAEKIRYLQMSSLRQKIVSYLLDISRKQKSQTVSFDYTIETLSEMFGVARPSLSRELGQLIDQGCLTRNGKKYTIIHQDKLISLLHDE
jgi:CRP-like cAMP-binding protein